LAEGRTVPFSKVKSCISNDWMFVILLEIET
jgi:hypothetical protein